MNAVVIQGERQAWDAAAWADEVARARQGLTAAGARVIATLLDNSPAFVALDEAALDAGLVHVPLPPFFTGEQALHALDAAGVDTLIASPALAAQWPQWPWQPMPVAGESLCLARRDAPQRAMPAGTVKITFTSGTTGQPKGVCLGREAFDAIAAGLVQVLSPLGISRHLSVLPYAVLLENVAGSMSARRQGATLVSLPTAQVGLSGSSRFDPAVFDRALRDHDIQSVILLPQMLRAWCGWLAHTGQRAHAGLRFVAVGGAAVGAPLLAQAQALGVPVFEGYGLSEGASVQTLNLPGAARPGSAGRALPHARLRISDGGEIEVSGSLHLGYLGDTAPVPAWWPTGDLGRLDADGFLFIEGRRKHVLITAFGRNVSPEWVETTLAGEAAIAQAVVMGDGQARLSAVIWPTAPASVLPPAAIASAVARANDRLPDYARIGAWTCGELATDLANGLFTPNGRPVRGRVHARYGPGLMTPDAPVATPAP